MSVKTTGGAKTQASVSTDTFTWTNQAGGAWTAAANWFDSTTQAAATLAPGAASAVVITGGAGDFIDITGAGSAASLAIANAVLLWGTVAVSGAVGVASGADLELDGGATLSASGLTLASTSLYGSYGGATLEVSGASALTISGATTVATASFMVIDGGASARFAALATNAGTITLFNGATLRTGSWVANSSLSSLSVDATSAMEIGSTGGVALGALTVDQGQSVAVSGTIHGNVVVNGVLAVQAGGDLTMFGAASISGKAIAPGTVTGTGTLSISEKGWLSLGADSAAIRFAGPNGGVYFASAPTGAVSGFANGDTIDVGFANAVSAKIGAAATILTLTENNTAAGTITLNGVYTGDLFHMSFSPTGDADITLRSPGMAPVQPGTIVGTAGQDTLTATASGQTLTGLGGGDTFNGGGFAGVVFKDTSANLNGATITNGNNADVIDLTDMSLATVTTSYTLGGDLNGVSTPTTLVVSDGTHTTTLTFPSGTQAGYFTASSDGASGTDLTFTAVQTVASANNQTLGALGGSETLYGGSFTGIDFKATSARLTGATIQGYVASDIVDLTDMAAGAAVVTYTPQSLVYKSPNVVYNPGTLSVSDGTHTVSVLFPYTSSTLPTGYFTTASDGAGGTDVSYVTVQTQATGNNQTLGGVGGSETLYGGGYTGIDFKGPAARLTGATIQGFDKSDTIDLTDLNPATATASFVAPSSSGYPSYINSPGSLAVSDGTHSVTLSFPVGLALPVGYFATGSDGAGGTDITYVAVSQDAFAFSAPLGGGYATAANWQDTTTSAAATSAPGYGNAVSIAGGSSYLDVTGNGVAASLASSGDVLLWGTLAVGAKLSGVSGNLTQSGSLALDGGASLTLRGTASVLGYLELGGGSKLVAGGFGFGASNAALLATGASTAQFAAWVSGSSYGYATKIAVDALSSIEFGTTGAAAKGALTVDGGQTVELAGTLAGNVVVNGTLLADNLTLAPFGAGASSITGSGTIAVVAGATLTLDGADAAAIVLQSAAVGFGTSSGTLVINASLPTGTISGFTSGDAITLNQTVTSLSYSQTTAGAGTLTLMNGATQVGTLALAGSFTAGQFQVQPGPGGASSSIVYAPTPSAGTGFQVSDNSDTYTWTAANGGAWGYAGNWMDGSVVASVAPGSFNTVLISDSTTSPQIISGSGSAGALNIYAPTVLAGDLTVASALYVSDYSSATGIANGALVTAASLTLYTALDVGGSSILDVTNYAYLHGNLTVYGSAVAHVTGATGSSTIAAVVAVDGTSTLEFGGKGGAASGALTVDSGQTLSDSGTIAAAVVVNGLLSISGADVIEGFGGKAGSVTGSGTIAINESGSFSSIGLVLDAASSVAISMLSYASSATNQYSGSTLELMAALPTGVIGGFALADAIRFDQTVTGASFKQTTSSQGTLTLTNGATTVGTLALGGSFTGELFHLDVSATTGVATLTLQAAPVAAGTSAASTGSDAYAWTGASGGVWSTAANWHDATTNATPATVPGAGNAVTIAGTTDSRFYTTVGDTGAAASLAVTGNVLLAGTVAVAGQTALATAAGSAAKLALDAGARLTTGSLSLIGTLEAGGASTLALTGGATLAGGTLLAMAGSSVTLHGLTGNGGNNTLAIDAASRITLGTVAAPVAGALNVASGATLAYTGSIDGNVVDNGSLQVAAGGAAFIDMAGTAEADPFAAAPTISGGGVLSVGEGATLGLGAADSAQVRFSGPNGTLQLATTQVGSIYGFAAGDSIVLDKAVSGLTVTQSGGTAVLTVTNGAATVATLKLAYTPVTGQQFHLDTAGNGASATITLQTIGIAAAQPTLITGTQATDLLYATANGQTLTGLGGGDTLNGAAFTGLDFKDLTANLNAGAIQNFAASDTLDFTDLNAASATVGYAGGKLAVGDGTHSASLTLGFLATPASGSFHAASDGGTGTLISWH